MGFMIDTNKLRLLHQDSIIRWEKTAVQFCEQGFWALVEENHAFNYQLWHAEDRARRDDKGPEFVYLAKREIDACNQARNDRMEAMDAWLFTELKPEAATNCPVHSETPGMMIDRLSILALKAHYMGLQTTRTDAEVDHLNRCSQKLQVIKSQQQQLLSCLQRLIEEVIAKTRTFRVYHQFKMYNDATLNPELYANE
jgi:hypothetical protein